MSDSLQSQGLHHARLPCLQRTPGACSNACPSSRWCHPTISSSVICFSSCLQDFPSIRVFSSESVLHIRGPKYWSFSFSIREGTIGLEFKSPIEEKVGCGLWISWVACKRCTCRKVLYSKNWLVLGGAVFPRSVWPQRLNIHLDILMLQWWPCSCLLFIHKYPWTFTIFWVVDPENTVMSQTHMAPIWGSECFHHSALVLCCCC